MRELSRMTVRPIPMVAKLPGLATTNAMLLVSRPNAIMITEIAAMWMLCARVNIARTMETYGTHSQIAQRAIGVQAEAVVVGVATPMEGNL